MLFSKENLKIKIQEYKLNYLSRYRILSSNLHNPIQLANCSVCCHFVSSLTRRVGVWDCNRIKTAHQILLIQYTDYSLED
jgi:hypothetical protein